MSASQLDHGRDGAGSRAQRRIRRRDGSAPVVAVDGVRKAYGQVIALNDVTLSVARGTIHGLVGPNGSGKTTLLNVMSGLARVDQGRVRMLGTRHDASARVSHGAARRRPHVPDAARVRGPVDLGEPADRRGLRRRPAARRLAVRGAARRAGALARAAPGFPAARAAAAARGAARDRDGLRRASARRAGGGTLAGRAARFRDAAALSARRRSARRSSWSSTTSTWSGAWPTGSRCSTPARSSPKARPTRS